MSNNERWLIPILAFICGIFGGLWFSSMRDPLILTNRSTVHTRDSVIIVRPADEQMINRIVALMRPQREGDDTRFGSVQMPDTMPEPYVDSTSFKHGGHEINVAYAWPQRTFSADWIIPMDTMSRYVRDYLRDTTQIERHIADRNRWGIGPYVGYGVGIDGMQRPSLGIALSWHIVEWSF